MRKKKINLRKILIPTDGVPIVVIVIGLLIAIFLPDIAIKLIGGCVSILGAVALFMLISQRLNDIVEAGVRKGSPPPGIKIKVVKGSDAIHKVVDGFDSSFGPDESSDSALDSNKKSARKDKKSDDSSIYEDDDRLQKESGLYKTTNNEPPINLGFEFDDGSSSMKIVGVRQKQEIQKEEIHQDKIINDIEASKQQHTQSKDTSIPKPETKISSEKIAEDKKTDEAIKVISNEYQNKELYKKEIESKFDKKPDNYKIENTENVTEKIGIISDYSDFIKKEIKHEEKESITFPIKAESKTIPFAQEKI